MKTQQKNQRKVFSENKLDHNIETKIIWALLFCRPEMFGEINLEPEDFTMWKFHWKEMKERFDSGISVDPAVKLYGDKFKMAENFMIATDGWANEKEIHQWATEIKNSSLLRQSEQIDDVEKKIELLSAMRSEQGEKDLLSEYYDWYCERKQRKDEGALGFKTGFRFIDEHVVLDRGHLATIAGRPSNGKSAFALNLAIGMAHYGAKVLFLSLESSANETMNRAISCATGKDFNMVEYAWVDDIQSLIAQYIDYTAKNLDIIDGDFSMTTAEIRRLSKGYDVVIVDQLSNLAIADSKETKASRVGEACYQLLNIARAENILVLMCAQINRGGDQEPKLIHLKDSGGIEEASIKVLFVHRPKLEESTTVISVPKNKSGRPNMHVKMEFQAKCMKFKPKQK